jgi:starch synthase
MPVKVLFVTSEIAPHSKTGGLVDISAALPRALKRADCDIRILTPKYGNIDPSSFQGESTGNRIRGSVEFHNQKIPISFLEMQADTSAAPTYFLECDALYDRLGIYVDPLTNQDYADNDDRYILLSRAAFSLCNAMGWKPEVFHCHDWQTALIPFYLRNTSAGIGYENSRSLLTIHNMAYHGLFDKNTVRRIGGAEPYFYPGSPIEFYDKVNFLKTGLELADVLNTVSPTYAREIQSAYEYGWGLETILKRRSNRLLGILNGIDDELWNPETDSRIPFRYTAESLDQKKLNKKALCKRVGLPYSADVPVIGSISRIVHQKGFQILAPVLTEVFNLPAQVVVLGTGDPNYEHTFREAARTFPDRFAVTIGYDEDLAHLIEAGADMFIMPSLYEPCGLNQMMSMRYGTLPVVRATGGLADSVTDADSDPEHGTGFAFLEYSSEMLLQTLGRALNAFRDVGRWQRIQRRAMKMDFSWNHSAAMYLELYHFCLENPPWEPQ